MSEAPTAKGRRRLSALVRSALLTGGVALLVGLVHTTGLEPLMEQLRRLGPGSALLFVLPTALAFAVETLAWRLAFLARPPVSIARLYLLYGVGENLNGLLPGVSIGGEPYKVVMLRRWGVPAASAVASILVMRTVVTLALATFVALGLAAALATVGTARLHGLIPASALTIAIAGGGIVVVYLLQRRGVRRLLGSVLGWNGPGRRWLEHHDDTLERLDQALERIYVHRPERLWLIFGLSLAGWLIEAAEVAVFSLALDLPLGLLEMLAFGALAQGASVIGTFVPASAGVQEGGIVLVGLAFGLDESASLAFAIVRRGRQLFYAALGLLPMTLFGPGGRSDLKPRGPSGHPANARGV